MESALLEDNIHYKTSHDIIRRSFNFLELKTNKINKELDSVKDYFKCLISKSNFFVKLIS